MQKTTHRFRKGVDLILLNLWKIIAALFSALSLFLGILLQIVKGLFKYLGRFEFFANLADNAFFTFWQDSTFLESTGEKCREYYSRFSNKMKESCVFRRFAFLIIFMLLLLYTYPPSHWGPWSHYQTGVASYYSEGFWFKKTASGERFLPFLYTAAHNTLPLGITVKVKNMKNGKVVYVKINDRGPFVKGRVIDLSSSAAEKIGIFKSGTAKVAIYTRKKYLKKSLYNKKH